MRGVERELLPRLVAGRDDLGHQRRSRMPLRLGARTVHREVRNAVITLDTDPDRARDLQARVRGIRVEHQRGHKAKATAAVGSHTTYRSLFARVLWTREHVDHVRSSLSRCPPTPRGLNESRLDEEP